MIPMWCGGEHYLPKDRPTIEVVNPMTQLHLKTMICGTKADIDFAINIAAERYKTWSTLVPAARESILLKCATLLENESEQLANIVMDESGSTIAKGLHEVKYGAEILRAAAGEARRLYGETIPDDKSDRFSLVVRESLGVVGVISPFNAPLALLIKMLSFPLAAGNTIVVKPSEETPAIAIALGEVFSRAGLPDGVLNIITGLGIEAGAALASHPKISGLTFTGSTRVGKMIGETLGKNLKVQHLELGGNNPLVICEDFPLDEAISLAVMGSYFHSGQICMSSSRIIVEASIFPAFKDGFLRAIEQLSFGKLTDEKTFYGPLINQAALDRMKSVMADAQDKGAQIICGGEPMDGLRFAPTLVENLSRSSMLWREEVFGPVASLSSFETIEQAEQLANDSDYGLSCGILTNNFKKGLHLAKKIRCGGVHLGSHPFQSGTMTPVGGMGLSGIGKSGGHYSTHHFTQERWISFNGLSQLG